MTLRSRSGATVAGIRGGLLIRVSVCILLVLCLFVRRVSRVSKQSSQLPERPSGKGARWRAQLRQPQRPCRQKRLLSRLQQAISASFMRAQRSRATVTRASCKPAVARARGLRAVCAYKFQNRKKNEKCNLMQCVLCAVKGTHANRCTKRCDG